MDTHEARLAKLRQQMELANLDLLVIYSDGRHTFLGSEPVLFVSGLKPLGSHSAVLVPKDDEASLIVTPSWDRGRAERRLQGKAHIKKVIAVDDLARELSRMVREDNLGSCKAGIIGGKRLSANWRDYFNALFSAPPIAFDQAFDEIAKVRDELELRLQNQAAVIADEGFEHLLAVAKPGMREYELAGEVDRFMKSLGADDNFQLMTASQHNQAVRAPGDRRLDVGDVILGEISPGVGGQFVQICRTAVLGQATSKQREKHQVLVDAMQAAMKAGVTGAPVPDVVRAINSVVTAAGYEKYCYPPYMRVRGHGFGMGSMMPGELSLDNQTRLLAGMTFVLHPNQYIPETGYFLVGEPVIVTDSGLKMLTSRPLGLAEIQI